MKQQRKSNTQIPEGMPKESPGTNLSLVIIVIATIALIFSMSRI